MLTTEWEKEMRGIEKQIAREVDHPDIREWTSPGSSRPLLWLLWSMTASAGLTPPVRSAVVAASYLVYRGLEIHEIDGTVEDDGAPPATAVLAGDFFSSKYYLLLAKHGLLSLIGVLAGAARQVSEVKAKRVGWRWEADVEGYRRLCVSAETVVFHALRRWLSLPEPWNDLIDAAGLGFALTRGGAWGRGAALPSLVDLHVWQTATAEERVAMREPKGAVVGRVRALYAKYNASGWIHEQLAAICRKIRALSESLPRPGAEGVNRLCEEWESSWVASVPLVKER